MDVLIYLGLVAVFALQGAWMVLLALEEILQ